MRKGGGGGGGACDDRAHELLDRGAADLEARAHELGEALAAGPVGGLPERDGGAAGV